MIFKQRCSLISKILQTTEKQNFHIKLFTIHINLFTIHYLRNNLAMPTDYPSLPRRALNKVRSGLFKKPSSENVQGSSSSQKSQIPLLSSLWNNSSSSNSNSNNNRANQASPRKPSSHLAAPSFPQQSSDSDFTFVSGRLSGGSGGSGSTNQTSAADSSNGQQQQQANGSANADANDSDSVVPPGQLPIGTCMGEPPRWFNQQVGEGYRGSRFVEAER